MGDKNAYKNITSDWKIHNPSEKQMKCKIMILEVLPITVDPKSVRDEIFIQTKDLEEVDIQRIIKAVNNIETVK